MFSVGVSMGSKSAMEITSLDALYRSQARHYLHCERLLVGDLPESRSDWGAKPLPYRLLGQAIELELKARHIQARSKSREQLSRAPYRHDLRQIYDELPPGHKSLTAAEYQALSAMDRIYNDGTVFDYLTAVDCGFAVVLGAVEELTQKIVGWSAAAACDSQRARSRDDQPERPAH
jgi:hypothetical protein